MGAKLNGQSLDEWEQLIVRLAAGGAAATTDLQDIMRICKPSYDALPLALKQCYLTFAAYPEDKRVPGAELVQLWAALAAVPVPGCEAAEKYLAELVARCLVLRDWEAYHMHDILRDLAVQEAGKSGSRCRYDVDKVRHGLCLDLHSLRHGTNLTRALLFLSAQAPHLCRRQKRPQLQRLVTWQVLQ